MTFEEMFERACAGHQPEGECLLLCYRFGFLEQDLPVAEMVRLEELVDQLDLDIPEDDDAATWSPDLLNEEP